MGSIRSIVLGAAACLGLCGCQSGPTTPTTPAGASSVAQRPLLTLDESDRTFPHGWVGTYEGAATLSVPQSKLQDFWMGLDVAAIEGSQPPRFRWRIIYAQSQQDAAEVGSKTRQVRDYSLVEVDAARGRFDIDEGQGLVIPCVLIGGELWSFFEVGDTSLAAVYRPIPGGEIEVTIITHPVTVADVLPTTKDKGVSAWLPGSMQRATLRRVK